MNAKTLEKFRTIRTEMSVEEYNCQYGHQIDDNDLGIRVHCYDGFYIIEDTIEHTFSVVIGNQDWLVKDLSDAEAILWVMYAEDEWEGIEDTKSSDNFPTISKIGEMDIKHTINFMVFGHNYPHNFIETVWADNPNLAKHLREKFHTFYVFHKYGTMTFFRWFMELSGGNREKLVAWVNNNYNG